MTAQDPAAGEGPGACPFVALIDDRDGRSVEPDPRHRCFAETEPAPRALAHQAHYCLAPTFPACPTFQDWARREAARVTGAVPSPAPPVVESQAWSAPATAHPVEPAEEAARPASRVVGLWGAMAGGGVAEPGEPVLPGPGGAGAMEERTTGEGTTGEGTTGEGTTGEGTTGEPVGETTGGRAIVDDATVVGLPAEVPPGDADEATAPVATPPFLAGRPRSAQASRPTDEVTLAGPSPRRLRPDDAGWASQVDMRRNLPPESSAYAGQPAERLRPEAAMAGGGALDARSREGARIAADEATPPGGPAPAGDVAPEPGPGEAPLPIYERLAKASTPPPPLDPEATAVELAAFLRRRAGGGEPPASRPTVFPATPMARTPPSGTAPPRTSPGAGRTVAGGGVLAAGGGLAAGAESAGQRAGPAGSPPPGWDWHATPSRDWGERGLPAGYPATADARPGTGVGPVYEARPGTGVGPVYEARPGTGVVPAGGIPAGYPPEQPGYPRSATQAARGVRPPVPVTGSQARPAIAGAKPRVTRDRNAPPWEPPARHEAYPTIRGRVSLPRIPRALILAAALLIAALLIFLAPSFFAGGGAASPTPSASRTPGSTAAASGSPVATVTPAPPSGQEPTVYAVVANDTVSGIAAKFGVTVEALLAANPQIKDPNQIAVGDKITIPPKGSPTPAKATPKPTPKPT